MFCICSNKPIDEIVEAQREIPLPFEDALVCYTSCLAGCGSCIGLIRERLEAEKLLIESADFVAI